MEISQRASHITTVISVMFMLLIVLASGCTRSKIDMDSQHEDNKAIIMRTWEEGFNQGNIDILDEVFDENYTDRTPYGVAEQGGPERAKQAFKWMHSMFGDLHFEVEQMIAEGDIVVHRVMVTGTHVGEFMGVPATGKPVRYAVVVVSRFSNGKVVEDWSIVDSYSILRQISKVKLSPLDSD